KADAQALADFASKSGAAEPSRLEALGALEQWEKPSNLDRLVGLYRPLSPRPRADVIDGLRPVLGSLLAASEKIRSAAAKLAARYGIADAGPTLRDIVAEKSRSSALRIDALLALEKLNDEKLEESAQKVLHGDDARLRHHARRILLRKLPTAEAIARLGE